MFAKQFKKVIEHWEYDTITTNLFGNRERLLNKYKNICFQDDDHLYTGRVVNVEWKKGNKSTPAGFSLVTVNLNDQAASDDNYEPYLINELFHDLIEDCDPELNKSVYI